MEAMSEDSQAVAEGLALKDLAIRFKTVDYDGFHAEYSEVGGDYVYHFWPPGEESRFPHPRFATVLERAFIETLPVSAVVHADYTDFEEASAQLQAGAGFVPQKDYEKELVKARETYYVRVVGAATWSFSELMLEKRVFETLNHHLEAIDARS